jgi:hypothetical protein
MSTNINTHNSFPDDHDREAFERQIKQLPPLFAEDLTTAIDMQAVIFGRLLDDSEPSPESKLETNLPKDLLGEYVNLYTAIGAEGYGVHLFNNAVDVHNESLPGSLRVIVDKEDKFAVRYILESIRNAETNPRPDDGFVGLRLLDAIKFSPVYSFTLDKNHHHYMKKVKELAGVSEEDVDSTLARLFLTSTLDRGMRMPLELDISSDQKFEEEARIYDAVREDGTRPYGFEEVQGIARSVVRQVLEGSRHIPKPSNKSEAA